ncbi:alpha/beta hydrolase [Porticoccaceae bacterium]|nr:alpha/beta hydrolase [Porticoccaceae bacterium]
MDISLWPLLLLMLFLLLTLHCYRRHWAKRDLPQTDTCKFSGQLMKVKKTYIGYRSAHASCHRTIICFPGFMEDIRYFQELYQDDNVELILVNNANYHCPFLGVKDTVDVTELAWPENPYQLGTIEYDAFYVGLVLEHLATGSNITMHGHSRGGAVVLETGRQYPKLTNSTTRSVSAILEAPVLPQARLAGKGSDALPHGLACYFLPLLLGWLRNSSEERRIKRIMVGPVTPLKHQLLLSVANNPRTYATCVTNLRSIIAWQRTTPIEAYNNFSALTVIMGEHDHVLCNHSMLASTEKGQAVNKGVSIVKTERTNHFISLERPEVMRAYYSQITS